MRRLPLLFLLCTVVSAGTAQAQRAYFDGSWQSNGTYCPVTGTLVTVLNTYTGYFTNPSEPYPRTGDLGYVHAVAANVAPCVNDAVGFDFFLPDGASLAISAANPVYCMRGRLQRRVLGVCAERQWWRVLADADPGDLRRVLLRLVGRAAGLVVRGAGAGDVEQAAARARRTEHPSAHRRDVERLRCARSRISRSRSTTAPRSTRRRAAGSRPVRRTWASP